MGYLKLYSWKIFLVIYFLCFLFPFIISFFHVSFSRNKIGRFNFLKVSSSYFILINVVFRSLILGFVRIEWGQEVAYLDHINYSFVFTEYGVFFVNRHSVF